MQNETSKNLDLLEDFFGMLFRFTKYTPQIVFNESTINTNLELANVTFGAKKSEVRRSLYLFIDACVKYCYQNPEKVYEKVNSFICALFT